MGLLVEANRIIDCLVKKSIWYLFFLFFWENWYLRFLYFVVNFFFLNITNISYEDYFGSQLNHLCNGFCFYNYI